MGRFLHPAHAQSAASTRFLCQWMKTRVTLRGPSGDLAENHFHRTSRTDGKNWEMRTRYCLFPYTGSLGAELLAQGTHCSCFLVGDKKPVFEVTDDSRKSWRKMCWRKWRWKNTREASQRGETAGKKEGKNKNLKSQHSNIRRSFGNKGWVTVREPRGWNPDTRRDGTLGNCDEGQRNHRGPSCGPWLRMQEF